jgi:hypothetical protein
VVVHTATGIFFAQLKFVFTITISDTIIPLALVQAYNTKPGQRSQKDKDFQFLHLQQRPITKTELIFAHSIIHGAVLFPAYDTQEDFLVFDVLDPDMFLWVCDTGSM